MATKVLRKIIEIDQEKCDGCGQCASACHEGAIAMVEGKAKLVSETYCDGLGACIGDCPRDALHIIEREVEVFDEAAVKVHLAGQAQAKLIAHAHLGGGCPGSALRQLKEAGCGCEAETASEAPVVSELVNWPVQLNLVPLTAPWLAGADLPLAADCVPFAVPDFHSRYLKGKVVLVGCPKLDDADYYLKKLTTLLETNKPASLSVVYMEVPCCGSLARLAEQAVKAAGVPLNLKLTRVGIDGGILSEQVTEYSA